MAATGDERIEWLQRRVCTSLDLSPKDAPLQDPDVLEAVNEWMSFGERRAVWLWRSPDGGALCAAVDPPDTTAGKIIVFRKNSGVEKVMHGAIAGDVVATECTNDVSAVHLQSHGFLQLCPRMFTRWCV